jgi:hypothetical protein
MINDWILYLKYKKLCTRQLKYCAAFLDMIIVRAQFSREKKPLANCQGVLQVILAYP